MQSKMRMAIGLVPLLLAGAALAAEGYITTTFGNTPACEHKGTFSQDAAGVRFDLSALRPGTKICRAILRVPSRGHQTGASIKLVPAGQADAKPLALLPPNYDAFDLTQAVAGWVATPPSNQGIQVVRSGGVGLSQAVLEVSYAGDVAKATAAVTDLRAMHQAGQTFLTFKEIEDPVGADAPKFEDFEKSVFDARKKRTVTYRLYRHDKPITVGNLGAAQLVREIPEVLTCWNFKAIANTEHPNQGTPTKNSPLRPGYNLARNHVMTRYRIANGGEPPFGSEPQGRRLPRATGLVVVTVTAPGKRYYAVTAAIDGREAVAELPPGASLREPVDEKVSKFPAIIYQRSVGKVDKRSRRIDVYNSWVGPPYHNVPTMSETYICRWEDLPEATAEKPLPLWVLCGTYGSTAATMESPGWFGARKHLTGAFTIGLAEGGLWQGFHECIGTLKGYDQGVVHNYPQRRVLGAAAWALWRKDFFLDPERVYYWAQLGSWAMRHGDVFAVVMSNGYANPAIGKQAQNYGPMWGPYPRSTKNWLGVDQWEYMNLPKWIRENPTVELPYWICWPAYGAYPSHTIGDFGFMPWPEMFHAMASTKRAFAANWSSNNSGSVRPLLPLVTRIRLHQSLPAFTNFSLDDSPGDGDHADAEKGGGINIYQLWEPETIVDAPGRWEITVHLRPDCPYPDGTTDLTPRRCQQFKAAPGEKFKWSSASLDGDKEIASGTAVADKWGLVTVEKITLTKEKQRIKIWKP